MSKGLEAFERIQCNYVYVFKARENGKTQLVHDLNTIKKELKALETIKECFDLNGFDELIPNSKWFESEEKQKLLKEVF